MILLQLLQFELLLIDSSVWWERTAGSPTRSADRIERGQSKSSGHFPGYQF